MTPYDVKKKKRKEKEKPTIIPSKYFLEPMISSV